jgi:hypothetical protein
MKMPPFEGKQFPAAADLGDLKEGMPPFSMAC